jgi:hypothetical protein
MHPVRRAAYLGYEDLMRELSKIERDLLEQDSGLAMELMALEARIRDRFQFMQMRLLNSNEGLEDGVAFKDDLTPDEIRTLIPQDISIFPPIEELEKHIGDKKKGVMFTVGWAAFLAVITAVGIFGLASILQLLLSWFA